MRLRLLPLLALLAFGTSAFAQYKWVDKDGKTRYGDAPPPGIKAQLIGPKPAPAPSAPAAKAPEEKKAPAATPQQALEKQQKANDRSSANRAQCEAAQKQVQHYESGQRIYKTNPSGERYYLSEFHIAQETAKAREAVQKFCKD